MGPASSLVTTPVALSPVKGAILARSNVSMRPCTRLGVIPSFIRVSVSCPGSCLLRAARTVGCGDLAQPYPLLRCFLQLVMPEQTRASVLHEHIEGQVLRVAPPLDDPARKPPQLGAKPEFAHPHPRTDARLFGSHVFPIPSFTRPASIRGATSESSASARSARATSKNPM